MGDGEHTIATAAMEYAAYLKYLAREELQGSYPSHHFDGPPLSQPSIESMRLREIALADLKKWVMDHCKCRQKFVCNALEMREERRLGPQVDAETAMLRTSAARDAVWWIHHCSRSVLLW